MRKPQIRGRQRGDTIVEVLVAIGIVSLVLTMAYTMSNRNRLAMQDTRERTQAQKLVENQIELLRNDDNRTSMAGRCYAADGTPHGIAEAACRVNGQNNPATGGEVAYNLSITIPAANRYTVRATWDTLSGSDANVTIHYYHE